jgi:hypothetical protein
MLPKLLNSVKSIKEIKTFKREIDKIKNDQARQRGNELLNMLKERSNAIDHMHTSFAVSDLTSEKIKENIASLVEVRYELIKLIKDANS